MIYQKFENFKIKSFDGEKTAEQDRHLSTRRDSPDSRKVSQDSRYDQCEP